MLFNEGHCQLMIVVSLMKKYAVCPVLVDLYFYDS